MEGLLERVQFKTQLLTPLQAVQKKLVKYFAFLRVWVAEIDEAAAVRQSMRQMTVLMSCAELFNHVISQRRSSKSA